ncbi:hypothetical protein BJQ97_00782 [Geobacillus sp. TFV-3]|nr:hypothetical protein BJQ97_00782 [Geobacillus sp. TFV-3]
MNVCCLRKATKPWDARGYEVEFVAELPKTPSGKIQQFILRNQEREKQIKA